MAARWIVERVGRLCVRSQGLWKTSESFANDNSAKGFATNLSSFRNFSTTTTSSSVILGRRCSPGSPGLDLASSSRQVFGRRFSTNSFASRGPFGSTVSGSFAASTSACPPFNQVQVRNMGGKKMKSWSSYKRRVKLLANGKYARSRCGNAHLASNKSKSQKRRLRQSTTTHSGYAKVMRKLGFKKTKYNL